MTGLEPVWPSSLLLIGGGKMGQALLEGWFKNGLTGSQVTVIDPCPSEALVHTVTQNGCKLNPQSSDPCSIVVLAIKPQMFETASSELKKFINAETLVLSIMAGKTVSAIANILQGAAHIVRAMPNTPVSVGRGISGIYAAEGVSITQKSIIQTLFNAVGQTVWLDCEADMDAVTAISGSGPAYVFYFIECLAQAGEAAGLSAEMSMRLARATLEGAGELLAQTPDSKVEILRETVTSPNGTTAAALNVLVEKNAFKFLVKNAVMAAKYRSVELSN